MKDLISREALNEVENKYRDELLRKNAYIQELEESLKAALGGKELVHKPADASTIWMEAIISGRTKEGLVNLRWGNMTAQLSIEAARQHAFDVLNTAEAAQSDAFLYHLFVEKLHANEAGFYSIIQDFRAYRERKS